MLCRAAGMLEPAGVDFAFAGGVTAGRTLAGVRRLGITRAGSERRITAAAAMNRA